MLLLYDCPHYEGGLAEYARFQGKALSRAGLDLLWHAPIQLPLPDRAKYVGFPGALADKAYKRNLGKLSFPVSTCRWNWHLAKVARQHEVEVVFLSAWSEYFSPIWANSFHRLRKSGVKIVALIHDPVRDYKIGPQWFHEFSVRKAYSILDLVFVHDLQGARRENMPAGLRLEEVPHGPYPVPTGDSCKNELRKELGIPSKAKVVLCFGHLRDEKNLDKAIEALPELPGTHLLIAGREQSSGQRPISFYQKLAKNLDVENQCHWHNRYIPNRDVWKFFKASDQLLLLYSRNFHSSSGVLHLNCRFRLPVIASGGEGPLLNEVRQYKLGIVVDPDDREGLISALRSGHLQSPQWDRYSSENSWEENAMKIKDTLSEWLPCPSAWAPS